MKQEPVYRLIKKDTIVWSIKNQSNIKLVDDSIVEITNTCYNSDGVFCKPMQLLYNLPGYIPTLIGRGSDEWSFLLSSSEPYTISEPNFL